MSKRDSKKPEPAAAPFNNPFGSLGEKLGPLPAGPSAPEPKMPAAPSRAVIRYERKGHGGKEVTRVEKLGLPAPELERWLRELKHSLGCGGTLDGEDLVLQGDQRERLRGLLEARGVRRVSR
ncbi:MAG: translation initiation factor [Myxococcales bacterium]